MGIRMNWHAAWNGKMEWHHEMQIKRVGKREREKSLWPCTWPIHSNRGVEGQHTHTFQPRQRERDPVPFFVYECAVTCATTQLQPLHPFLTPRIMFTTLPVMPRPDFGTRTRARGNDPQMDTCHYSLRCLTAWNDKMAWMHWRRNACAAHLERKVVSRMMPGIQFIMSLAVYSSSRNGWECLEMSVMTKATLK